MINRREVIASGLAVSILARTSAAGLSTREPSAESLRVPCFVADERFSEACEAARAAAAGGVASTMTLGADVTAMYESLDQAWRTAKFAVSGMTTSAALFVLERLAWDHGLRTAYRGIHRVMSERRVRHDLFGSTERLRSINNESGSWAARVGQTLARWNPREAIATQPVLLSQLLPSADRTMLVSWLLTPRTLGESTRIDPAATE
jgi:hypothetical protein